MKNRTIYNARKFNIYDNCKKLEDSLLKINGIVDVDFDLSGFYDGDYQIIILVKYRVPMIENKTYYQTRKEIINNIINVAKANDLERSEDAIEDYGEHFYFVFDTYKPWLKEENI